MKQIALGVLLCFFLLSCSTSAFFYRPSHEYLAFTDTLQCKQKEVFFPVPGGASLNGWWLRPKNGNPVATVLFLHGNAANISYQYKALIPLVEKGFEAFIFDYEGYGKSSGKASQEDVLEDARAALDYVSETRESKGKMILYGQSLGGHLAVVLCAQQQERFSALVTEGAFASHEEIARDVAKSQYKLIPGFFVNWIVPSKYDAVKEIGKIRIPKLIIHSTEDATVPYKHATELYNASISPKELWTIKGPHVCAYRLYKKEFEDRFLNLIRP